jgi:hypothetical protein
VDDRDSDQNPVALKIRQKPGFEKELKGFFPRDSRESFTDLFDLFKGQLACQVPSPGNQVRH